MDPHLEGYARNLGRREAALSYSTKYERIWHKRISDRVERRVLAAAVAATSPPHRRVLDLPCGAGRLTRELARHGAEIWVGDWSLEQLRLCRLRAAAFAPRAVRADCFRLPFATECFDLVFSARLSHHIADDADRQRYLGELFRVSRRWVIATVFDAHSLKNRLRELSRRLGSRKRRKFTMSLESLEAVAEANRYALCAAIPLSRLFSGHRYCVFERAGSPEARSGSNRRK